MFLHQSLACNMSVKELIVYKLETFLTVECCIIQNINFLTQANVLHFFILLCMSFSFIYFFIAEGTIILILQAFHFNIYVLFILLIYLFILFFQAKEIVIILYFL